MATLTYQSERYGAVPVSRIAAPWASRILAKHGDGLAPDVRRALELRASLLDAGAVVTDVPGFGGCRMLRGARGRFVAAAWRAGQ
jgi:hypothetical protein